MENTAYKVLVPHDFTSVADTAINHAAKIASIFDGGIYLLHIVGKDKEVGDAREKLTKIAEEAAKTYNLKVEPIIRIGNIFEDIGDVATEIDARLIVMGTHGVKGIQKLVGSYALKVITHSKVPFIFSGGMKEANDIIELAKYSECNAIAAASILHYNDLTIQDIKKIAIANNLKVRR